MTGSPWRRLSATAGLLTSLAGPPLLLVAVVGPPAAAGRSSWQWLVGGLRYQYLPVEPLLATLGALTWMLWGYVALATGLRLVAVLAIRYRVGGSARLLGFSNLVTVGPLRSLVDAAVEASLLASVAHAVAVPAAVADPPAVVRTLDVSAPWDRPPKLKGAVQADTGAVHPDASAAAQSRPGSAGTAGESDPGCPATASDNRLYTVIDGDSLWRIAERELGDGTAGRRSSPPTKDAEWATAKSSATAG